MSTNLSKLIFFDFEVFKYDWLAVFNCDNHEVIVMNDSDELEKFVTGHSDYYFVGFNNYHYDDEHVSQELAEVLVQAQLV